MDDGKALLLAILRRPAEDTPRLVYADYLEETGDPDWAGIMRTRAPLEGDPLYPDARHRAVRKTLHDRCFPARHGVHCFNEDHPHVSVSAGLQGSRLFGHTRGNRVAIDARHGFVSGLACCWRHFNGHAREWFSLNPIERVVIHEFRHPHDVIDRPWRSVPAEHDTDGDPHRHFYPSWGKYSTDQIPRGIPAPIWELLEGHCELFHLRPHAPHKCYRTLREARRALSDALVAYGLERAGRTLAS